MKNTIKGIIIGVIVTVFLGSSVMAASSISLNAVLNNLNISINGSKVANTGDTYSLANGKVVPFSVNIDGTTYLPLRKVAELLGKNVNYDSWTNTAVITDESAISGDCVQPIDYDYYITYGVDGEVIINIDLKNVSQKEIESVEFLTYMYNDDFRPITNSKGTNITYLVVEEDEPILPGEKLEYAWGLESEYRGSTNMGCEIITVNFADGSEWYVND